jgi:KipI family sensor histidine kinase inhibitor
VSHQRFVRRYGDSALFAETRDLDEAHGLARGLRASSLRGVEDVVVGEKTVTVIADLRVADFDLLVSQLATFRVEREPERAPRRIEVDVDFDGPDLEEIARIARLSPRDVVAAFTSEPLRVAFLGFAPGFAYLSGLPQVLARIPRRATPRASVPAGSLALAGGFASIYPNRSPGGWHLLGRTDVSLFDPETPPFALLGPGDIVSFRRGDVGDRPDRGTRERLSSNSDRTARVEHPGFMSLVEDGGRLGVASLGVPRAGAADERGLLLSNRLVGNDDTDAAIEVTGNGPALRLMSDSHAACVGEADVLVDGRHVSSDAVVPIREGQVLSVGPPRHGLRIYVALSGGIDTPVVMGSRSSDVLCGVGPGPLRAGDVLGLGPVRRAHGSLSRAAEPAKRAIRVVPGPDELSEGELERLCATSWEVARESDRVGLRLSGGPLRAPVGRIASRATVTGAVQLPPDGAPIVLLCDHATVGGYPVVATVTRADVGRLGQLRPGDRARFEVVDQGAAKAALHALDRDLKRRVGGWYPVRTD